MDTPTLILLAAATIEFVILLILFAFLATPPRQQEQKVRVRGYYAPLEKVEKEAEALASITKRVPAPRKRRRTL